MSRADRKLARTRSAVAGKRIAITGGARGIGFEIAAQLRDHGAQVVIGDIDVLAVEQAAADLGMPGCALDVTDRASFESFLDDVDDRLGGFDVLVNNAGIMPVGSFLDHSGALLRRTVDVDLVGVLLGTQLAARRMVAGGGGQVVNVASVAGRLPNPGLALYSGVKSAVIEFSEALDVELRDRGVRVCAVLPTFTRTGLIDGLATNALVTTVEPELVARQVVSVIARPRTRVAAPGWMRWVDLNPALPPALKRRFARLTGTDAIFLNFDAAARGDYSARIGQES